jgi:hypothetical protein
MSKGFSIQIRIPQIKFEKISLVAKARAVLIAPVIIVVYSVGIAVKEGNPSIKK